MRILACLKKHNLNGGSMSYKLLFKTAILSTLFTLGVSSFASDANAGQEALEGRKDGRVVATAPKANAAFVPKFTGIANNVRGTTEYGSVRTNNEGIVIRGSYVDGNKVIIPASGLYVTNRSTNLSRLAEDPYVIGGKVYYFITDLYEQEVIRNVVMKKGDVAWIGEEKARGFELSAVSNTSWYTDDSRSATFNMLKTTGNYYGSNFPVQWSAKKYSLLSNKGTSLKAGAVAPSLNNKAGQQTMLSPVASVGRSWVVVDKITEDGQVHVKEMVTDNNIGAFFSPMKPTRMEYAQGESWKDGDYTMTIDKLTANSVTVSITDPTGTVTKVLKTNGKNTFTPIDTGELDQFWMKSNDGKVIAHLNIRSLMKNTIMISDESIKAAIADNKAKMVIYKDVFFLEPGKEWFVDNRFLTRPET